MLAILAGVRWTPTILRVSVSQVANEPGHFHHVPPFKYFSEPCLHSSLYWEGHVGDGTKSFGYAKHELDH